MKAIDYTKIVFDVFFCISEISGRLSAFTESHLSHDLVYIMHLMFHLVKHLHQAKLKFHLDYYKSNRWFIIFQPIEQ